MKKILKILKWVVIGVVALVVLVILLLSFLFPSSVVKDIVLDNLREQLKREVSLQELDFNIFKGLSIKGLDIKERPAFGTGSFVKIKSVKVDYDVLALIGRKFVLKQATVEGLEIYGIAKKINGKTRMNFDDIIPIPEPQRETKKTEEKVEKETETKEMEKPVMKKPAMPLAFRLGKVGIENLKLDFQDHTNPILPVQITVDRVSALITNLTSGNEPFGIKTTMQISFAEIKKQNQEKNFNLFTGIEGKIKPFDNSGYLNPEMTLTFSIKDFLTDGGFLQTAINNGLKMAMVELVKQLEQNLPAVTEEIKKKVQPEIDKLFANVEEKIEKIKKEQGLTTESLKKEKENQMKDFDAKIGSALSSALNPILAQTDGIPSPAKEKAREEINKKKDEIQAKVRDAVSKELDKIIVSAEQEYQKQIQNLKSGAKSQIDKLITVALKEAAAKIKEWAKNIEKSGLDLSFLDKKLTFEGGSITIHFKDWKVLLKDMDLSNNSFGIKGNAEYAIFEQTGKLDNLLFLPASFDKIGLLKQFEKQGRIELPLNLSFNQKLKEYKLNNLLLSVDQLKEFALKFGVDFVKSKISGGDKTSETSIDVQKYKDLMQKVKQGKITEAAQEIEQTKAIVENYKKAQEAVKKAEEGIDKLKKLKKKF